MSDPKELKERANELLDELRTVSAPAQTAAIIMILESLGDRLALIEEQLKHFNEKIT